jgi:anaerobic magnesium-protoporphyrin IX monomethyl ester cyclase
MKVLLVRSNPTQVENTRLPSSLSGEVGTVMPLGIASIAAYLRQQGKTVALLDAEAEALDLRMIRSRIRSERPDIVGITSMTPTVHDDLDVARIARQEGAVVVVGGPHANAMPVETAFLDAVDFVIRGEGEIPMLKLVDSLEKGVEIDDRVPGIVFQKKDGSHHVGMPYINKDLDRLPFPAWDLLKPERYHSIISKDRLATVSPNRGCPFRCGFCFKQPSDKRVRFRSAVRVVDEIEELVSRYKVKEINFVSDTLTVKRNFVFEMCDEILKRGLDISWIAPTRADCVDRELLQKMKKAGCRSLRFGVESGSPQILKNMDKDTDISRYLEAFRLAREVGIESFAYLIVGYIGETWETMQETLAFVKKLKPDLLMYNVATPLPETKLFSQAVAAGIVEKDYWQRFLKDRNTPRIAYLVDGAEDWVRIAYRSFYFSPRILIRQALAIRPETIPNSLRALRGLLRL